MKLKKIRLKNIRSYEDQEIDFSAGSLLLAGDVGAGKTTILLAIEYSLFGLQPGQTGSALLRNGSAYGEVVLSLEIDNKEVLIERRLKRSSRSVINDYASITINGDKIDCSITELKIKILNLLQYPIEFLKKNNLLYRYTVYTPQEQMKQIILEDAETRLNILRHVFGVDKYKTIRENLSIIINKIKENIKMLQGEIKDLDSEKNRLIIMYGSVDSLKDKIKFQDKELLNLIKKRKDIELEVTELEAKIKEREKFEIELEKTKIFLASKRENITSLKKEYTELERITSSTQKIFNEKDLEKIKNKILEERRLLDKSQSNYIEIMAKINSLSYRKEEAIIKKDRVFKIDICPTCLQNVPEVHKHNITNDSERTISNLSKELESLEKSRIELLNSLEREKNNTINLEEQKTSLEILKSETIEIERSRNKFEDIKKLKENLEKDYNMLSNHMTLLKENIFAFAKFNNLYRIKKEELKESFKNEKNAEITLAEFNKEVNIISKDILILEERIKDKEDTKKRLFNLMELNDWLSNHFTNLINFTEKNIMMKLRLEFSRLFSKWFHIIADNNFEIKLDENFTPLIIQTGTEMDYSFLSGGERTAVALAYRLALNQTINSIMSEIKTRDIIILDEPTEGFSEAQIEKMRDILEELNIKQLIIVSHEQKIEGFVHNVIKIKKEADISYIDSLENQFSINQKT